MLTKGEERIETLIVQDTFISGQAVFAGETHNLERETFDRLKELGRAIARKDSTKEILGSLKQKKTLPKTFNCDKELSPEEAFVAWNILRNKWIGRFSPMRLR